MIATIDWRQVGPGDAVPLVETEAREWLRCLHWDVADAWHVIEPARLAGQLPGALLLEDGKAVGWTAYLEHANSLQVMAFVAPDEHGTRALVDAVMASPEADRAATAIVCVRDVSPGLFPALRAHHFDIEPYRYLVAPLGGFAGSPLVGEVWPLADEPVARLFQRAYAEDRVVRAFAPNGTELEWKEYLGQLRRGPGCGWYQADLSRSMARAGATELDAAILVTQLGPGTVHVAQVAVDPSRRRQGLARRLLESAFGMAATRFERATLLVSEANVAAGQLYANLGFEEAARFVVATRRRA